MKVPHFFIPQWRVNNIRAISKNPIYRNRRTRKILAQVLWGWSETLHNLAEVLFHLGQKADR